MNRINCRKCNLVNFADDACCRRCGAELAAKARVRRPSQGSGFLFPLLVRALVLAVILGVCYFGYITYREESEKVAKQQIQIKQEQERIKSAYVDSIKNEVKKIATPTP